MNNTRLQQLQQLMNGSVEIDTMSKTEWVKAGGAKLPESGDQLELDQGYTLVTKVDNHHVQVLRTQAELTLLEKELLSWLAKQGSMSKSGSVSASEMERQARKLGEWLQQSIDAGEWRSEIPERFELHHRLFDGMIPFLLMSEQAENREPSYVELEKVLRSYLSDDMLLIPLREREWLILGTDRLLAEVETNEGDMIERGETKEALVSLATGLHQMITEEWGGDCHVAVGEPIIPTESLVYAVATLRETINLGRKFHVGMHVHMPWLVHLERLLSGIPEPVRSRFMDEMSGRQDLFTDPETVSTLDAFFAMDCNVSETAKRLFIHRNTLLYRLDKLKQEAGLDVRSFNDAILVRLLMLLYKVTKRK
ncbi:CdaR family transcriptional regulator [Cohnella sp. OV330]|uniref:PucR family transcriptional regulator n=1 Tax=Cohnella sp. OV330 TaxID=1855288 RepID=UPI000AC480B1|nr:helix-turn-helix domain-containing protein [Cohnella sp. OV330]